MYNIMMTMVVIKYAYVKQTQQPASTPPKKINE